MDHPNILKIYEYFEDNKNFYLITELCTGGELFDKIIEKEYFTENEACKVFKQILMGVAYCHKEGIVHRDLKPENLLVDRKGYLKVVDFGTAKIVENRTYTVIGTPHYMAPEVI